MSKKRTRTYACIVYPESAPDDWMNVLRESAVMGFISPLHDSDRDKVSDDGEIHFKKPHYHVMIMYDGVKTEDQFNEFKLSFGGVGTENVNSTIGYARYLCHLDNPEKHQYSINDVISLGGSDYLSIIGRSADRYEYINQMLEFIEMNHVTSLKYMVDYSRKYNQNWFRCLADGSSYFIIAYLKDSRN